MAPQWQQAQAGLGQTMHCKGCCSQLRLHPKPSQPAPPSRAPLTRLPLPPPAPSWQSPEAEGVLEALRSCQEEARRKHLGLFTYGDPDSDEDDGGFPALGGARGAGRGAGRR